MQETYASEVNIPTFTQHPESVKVLYGETVKFKVTASGNGLTYQWQYKPSVKNGSWTNTGSNSNELSVLATYHDQYLYRCLISDSVYSGDSAIQSNAACLHVITDQVFKVQYVDETPTAPVIITQPQPVQAVMGSKATFTVEATGDNLEYQWQYKPSVLNGTWTNATEASAKTNTYTTAALTYENSGYEYRCIVRDKDGYYYGDQNAVTSDSAMVRVIPEGYTKVIYINESYNITAHPASRLVLPGESVTFSVKAEGNTELTYRWLYKSTEENSTWTEVPTSMGTGTQTDTLVINKVLDEYDNYMFRCSVGGSIYVYEKSLLSNVAYLMTIEPQQIITAEYKPSFSVNGTCYPFLQSAYDAIEGTEGTIVVYEDVEDDSTIVIEEGKNVTIDTNGKTLTLTKAGITNNGTLTIDGTGTIKTINNAIDSVVYNNGTLNVVNGTIEGTKNVIYNTATGNLTVGASGGSVSTSSPALIGGTYGVNSETGFNFYDGVMKGTTAAYNGEILEIENEYTLLETSETVNGITKEVATLQMEITPSVMITEWTIPVGGAEIQLPVAGTGLNVMIDWGDGTSETWTDTTAFPTHTYTNVDEQKFDIKVKGTVPEWGYKERASVPESGDYSEYYTYSKYLTGLKQWGELNTASYGFSMCKNLKYVSGDATENTFANMTNATNMFYHCTNVETIDLNKFDTALLAMKMMFNGCENLKTLDISNLNTSNVKSLYGTFDNCKSLESLDVLNFDVSNVKSFYVTFNGCSKLETLDLSNWNTSSANDMQMMFEDCNNLKTIKIDTEKFSTANVKKMSRMFNNCYALTTIDVSKFNTSNVNLMNGMFGNCKSLTDLNLSSFNTTNVNNIERMFEGCINLSNLTLGENFKTDSVNSGMYRMFYNCSALTELDLSNWNVENVTDMKEMFTGCTNLQTLNISSFVPTKVISMQSMFSGCSSLKELDLSNFKTSSLTNMYGMFGDCSSLTTLDLTAFDTRHVTTMQYAFSGCSNLVSLDLSSFDTSKVTTLSSAFNGCSSLESLDIESLDTNNVTNMVYTFSGCTNLKSILISNKFVVSGDCYAASMFAGASSLSAIITTSSTPVTNQFNGMIPSTATLYVPNGSESAYAEALSGDTSVKAVAPILQRVGDENIVLNIGSDYTDAGYTVAGFTTAESDAYTVYGYAVTENGDVNTYVEGTYPYTYDLTRIVTNASGDTTTTDIGETTRTIEVVDTKSYMITEWTIPAGGAEIELPVKGNGLDITIDWGDGTITKVSGDLTVNDFPTHTYTNTEEKKFDISIRGNCPEFGYYSDAEVTAEKNTQYLTFTEYLTGVKQWGRLNANRYGFAQCVNLTEVSGDVAENTFKNVTNMSYMFNDCKELNYINVNGFDTPKVTNMSYMFKNVGYNVTELVLDLEGLNTSAVTSMQNAFEGVGYKAQKVELKISEWDTSKVTSMNNVFRDTAREAKSFKINLSNWDLSSVTDLSYMFNYAGNKATDWSIGDLSNWDTSGATNMEAMFQRAGENATTFNLGDISNWDTSGVTDMSYMFNEAGEKATTWYVGTLKNWNTSDVTTFSTMFQNAGYSVEDSFKLDLSKWNISNATDFSYMFFQTGYNAKEWNIGDISNWDVTKAEDLRAMFQQSAYNAKNFNLDISGFNTRNASDIGYMFSAAAKNSTNKNILLGENYKITNSTIDIVFDSVSGLNIILVDTSGDQFTGVDDMISDNLFYVPNQDERDCEINWGAENSPDRIRSIIELSGDKEIDLLLGEDYIEPGYFVAGYTEEELKMVTDDGENLFGFNVTVSGEVDIFKEGTYTIEYILTKSDAEGNVTKITNDTRTVKVHYVEPVKNFIATGKEDDNIITLNWDDERDDVVYVIEANDGNGIWEEVGSTSDKTYIHENVFNNKTYEYRLKVVTAENYQSEYVYAICTTNYDEISVIIRHDNIKPEIIYISTEPEKEFINAEDTLKIRIDTKDANYYYEDSKITAENIIITVSEYVDNNAIVTTNKLKTESGEAYEIIVTNITGFGNIAITVKENSIIDKAGNGNDEIKFELVPFAINNSITDDAPTVDVNVNTLTITNNQTSFLEIAKIEYQYRESGETEYITTLDNVVKGLNADTEYEIRTVVTDVAGNYRASQSTIIKTAAMDDGLITITADVTTFTSGDVVVTIDYTNTYFSNEYSLDGEKWDRIDDSKITLRITQNTVIYARYVDEQTTSDSVIYTVNNIDKEKPIIENDALTPPGKANVKEMYITGVRDIGVSGIKGYYINTMPDLDDATWTSFEGTGFTYTITENNTYYVWVCDNAGNISQAKVVIVNGIVEMVQDITLPDLLEIKVGESKEIPLEYNGEAKEIIIISNDENIVLVEPKIQNVIGISSGETTVDITIINYDDIEIKKSFKVIVKPVEIDVFMTVNGEEYIGEWTNQDVDVILSVDDYSPTKYEAKNSQDGTWEEIEGLYVNSITGIGEFTHNTDFSGEVSYIGYNSIGKIVTTETDKYTIKVDKTAPMVGRIENDIRTNSMIVEIVEAEDSLSGIKEYKIEIYLEDELLETYIGEEGKATFSGLTSSTTYGIKYTITDNAGNTTELIDGGTFTTAEVIKTVTYDYLTNGGETVTLESEERKAGTLIDLTVTATKTGYEFLGWSETPNGEVLESLVMPEEDITLYAIFKDTVGPVLSDKDYETVDGDLQIIVKAEDDGSGVADYAVTTDEGSPKEWLPIEEDENGEIRITVPGTNNYYVWIRDLDGNFTMYEQVAIKDIFAPTGTIYISGDNRIDDLPYSQTQNVLISITAEDNESAPEDIKVAIYNSEDYANITSYSQINFAYNYQEGGIVADFMTSPGDGLKRIYIIFKDKAGNISITIKNLGESKDTEYIVHHCVKEFGGDTYQIISSEAHIALSNIDLPVSDIVKNVTDATFVKASKSLDGEDIGRMYKVSNSGITEIYLHYDKYTASEATYTVEHWLQNINAADEENEDNYTKVSGDTKVLDGTINLPVTPEVNTYEGFTSPEAKTEVVTSDGSLVINYYYKRNSYDVTLNAGTGISEVTGAGSYQYGAEVTINATVLDGYTWNNWTGTYEVAEQSYTFQMPATKVENTANAKANTDTPYKVYYYIENANDDGYTMYGEVAEKTGTTGATINFTTEAKVIPNGTYSYGATSKNGEKVENVQIAPDGTTEIHLYYTRNRYNLTLVNGDYIETVSGDGTYKVDETVTISATLTANEDGYTNSFVGWESTNIITIANATSLNTTITMIAEDVTITARGTQIANTDTPYMVYHYLENANDDEYTLVREVQKAGTTGDTVNFTSVAEEIEYGTYSFGTTSEGGETVSSTEIAADGTTETHLYYVRDRYELTLEKGNNIENVTESNTYKVGQTVNIDATIEDNEGYDYIFIGWTNTNNVQIQDENATSTSIVMPATNAKLTAEAVKTAIEYEITVDCNGGSGVENTTYTIETETFTLGTPTRIGYTFTGWTGTDLSEATKTVTIAKGSTGDRSYIANWEINQYTITFNSDGGSAVAQIKQDYGTTITAPAAPTKAGYTFAGWTPALPTTMPATNTSVKATWTANTDTAYTVYHYFENVNDTGYTLNKTENKKGTTDATLTLANLATTITGGTYSKGSLTAGGSEVTTTTIAGDGNTKVYLYYTRNTYTVILNANGGNVSPTSIKVTYGGTYSALPTSTRDEYTFLGWFDAATGGNEVTTSTTVGTSAKDQILYAHWELAIRAFAVYSADDSSLTFYKNNDAVTAGGTYNNKAATNVYTGFETATYANSSKTPWYTNRENITTVTVAETIAPVSTAYWFAYIINVSEFELSKLNTENVVAMHNMFESAGARTTEFAIKGMEKWNTSRVKSMNYMFSRVGYDATSWDIGDLSKWDTSNVTNMSSMFSDAGYSATEWNIGDLSNWNTSNVTNMSSMFSDAGYHATTIALDLSNWNTSNVTNMSSMFSDAGYHATTIALDLSNWNTSNVTNMRRMFYNVGNSVIPTRTIILDLSNWNTSKVTDMGSMFRGVGYYAAECSIVGLSNWNTSNVTDMSYMFDGVGKWYTTTFIIGDLSNWNTSNVTDMSYMFNDAGLSATEWNIGDLSSWNTSSVTDMSHMFFSAGYSATEWNIGDLSNWDTSNVTNMSSMFLDAGYYATTIALDLSNWNTSNVTNMSSMFRNVGYHATPFSLDLSGFDTGKVTDMTDMFTGMRKLSEIKLGAKFSFNGSGTTRLTNLPTPSSSNITGADGKWYNVDTGVGYTPANVPNNTAATYTAVKPVTAFAVYSATDNSLTFYKNNDAVTAGGTYNNKAATNVYTGFETATYANSSKTPWYSIKESVTNVVVAETIKPKSTAYWFMGFNNTTTMNLNKLDTSSVTDMRYMFCETGYNATNFEITGLNNWDTSSVKNMGWMFNTAGYYATTWSIGDLSSWDTSSVTNMCCMFCETGYNATNFEITGLNNWDTSSVKDMSFMFSMAGGSATTWNIGDLSDWVTTSVTDMNCMFQWAGCSATTFSIGDLSSWDTSSVKDMNSMFLNVGSTAKTFSIGDLSRWDTSSVKDMNNMFCQAGYSATTFSLDLSSWDTSSVTNMYAMFYEAGYKATEWSIGDLSKWNTSSVSEMSEMFSYAGYNATPFSLDLSGFDTSKVTDMTDMFTGMRKLSEIKLGAKFSFNGSGTTRLTNLPTPSSSNIPGSDGKWYNKSTGAAYTPANVPNNTAATYTAVKP